MSEALDLDVRNAEPAMSEGAELLAARLEIARLRAGLEESKRTAHADLAKARESAKGGCGLCRELALHLARCHAVLTAAPPPALAELRELMAAVKAEIDEWIESGDGEGGKGYPPERLGDAYAAVLAAHPVLESRGHGSRPGPL